jgi:hypothetical protein
VEESSEEENSQDESSAMSESSSDTADSSDSGVHRRRNSRTRTKQRSDSEDSESSDDGSSFKRPRRGSNAAAKSDKKVSSSKPVRGAIINQRTEQLTSGKRLDPETKRQATLLLNFADELDQEWQIFASAVDPDDAPGYYSIIENPMDLGTLR